MKNELLHSAAHPATSCLPLKILHGFAYREDQTIAEKQCVIRAKLEELSAKGFGGIVTNVHAGHHYLRSEEEWQLLRYTFQTCHEMGLRTWLYDEKGYPSGGAGGITLEGHPEWQAQALAIKAQTFAPGEKISLPFPRGHQSVFAAYAWRADGLDALTDADIDHPYKVYSLSGQSGIEDVNDTDGPITAALILRKDMYEGTHAIHNVCESRRYIDVSNKEAVAAFIDNTYRPYAHYLKNTNPVEAIFTDEPSYMGAYINLGSFPASKLDDYDETMEMLPSVNFGADVENRFQAAYGYSLREKAAYLFCVRSRAAQQLRMDYYHLLSDLYEQSFFAQISDYCARNDMPFSGHVLLEDDIRYHPVFEGNFFSLLRHMHIPGIDMLNGLPELIRADAFTPKLVSSIAHTYGRPHVMSEISAHAQGGKNTPAQFLGTMYSQYVLGVDIFNSYFSENQVDAETYRSINETIGRVDALMGGGKHISGVAVYYPFETIAAGTLPFAEQIYSALDKNHDNTVCWRSMRGIADTLMANQIDYDYLDCEALSRCDVRDGVFTSAGGEEFRVLVLPCCLHTPALREQLRRLHRHGVRVLFFDAPEFPCRHPERARADVQALPAAIAEVLPPVFHLENEPRVLYLCRENQNGRVILAVNTSGDSIDAKASVSTLGDRISLYDPLRGESVEHCDAADFRLKLEPYAAVMILAD